MTKTLLFGSEPGTETYVLSKMEIQTVNLKQICGTIFIHISVINIFQIRIQENTLLGQKNLGWMNLKFLESL